MTLLLAFACADAPEMDVAALPPTVVPVEVPPTDEELRDALREPETAPAALEALVERGATSLLVEVAQGDPDVAARGWAITGLVRLGEGEDTLEVIQSDPESAEIVQVWAAAGRIAPADEDELRALEGLTRRWPGLRRPIDLRRARLGGAS